MEKNILGTERISKLFLKFCIPAIVSMVIAGAQTIIDGIFLGNYVGQNALASVNIVQPFMQLIIGISMIISVGSLSFIGRSLGEGKVEEARDIFKTATVSIFLSAVLILVFGVSLSGSIARVLGANDVLVDGVSSYVGTISLFPPIMALMFLFGFINRVVGKPELYLKGMMLSVAMNISLDYMLIKVMGLGIRGAAFATGLSYLAAFFVVMLPMLDRKNTVNVFCGKFRKDLVFPMVYNGSSEGVISAASATTAYLFNVTFMKIAGEAGVAAFTTINYISQFGILIMFGISDGIGPILSYNYGNGNSKRVSEVLKLSYRACMAFGAFLFLLLFGFGRELVSMFANGNADIIELASSGSKLFAFSFLMCGFNIINSGYFTAIGDARSSIVIAASRGIVFVAIGINILPMVAGNSGVWLTIPFAELAALIIGGYILKRGEKVCVKTV